MPTFTFRKCIGSPTPFGILLIGARMALVDIVQKNFTHLAALYVICKYMFGSVIIFGSKA